MRVRARRFITKLYREHGLPAPAARHVEITYYGDVAGYCLEVVAGARVWARIVWCPQIEHRAHVLRGLPRGKVAVAVLNKLVVDFLKTHSHGLSPNDCIDILKHITGLLGEAIALRQWTIARRLWALLSPMHTTLIAREPLAAHLAKALAENEAMEDACPSAIH